MTPLKDDDPTKRLIRGRRGGRTTVTLAMIRKTFWMDRDVDDRIREEAATTGRTEAEIVRQILRDHYGIE